MSPAISPMIKLLEDRQTSRLIKQGAEAKVYISELFPKAVRQGSTSLAHLTVQDDDNAVLIKYRFPKTYRHPTLSAQLTALRTTAEARALVRCGRAGVNTPRIICVDEQQGVLGLELIDGHSVRELLGGGAEGENEEDKDSFGSSTVTLLSEAESMKVMWLIGVQIGRMHQAHIIHGDLTTSNMMVRRRNRMEVVSLSY